MRSSKFEYGVGNIFDFRDTDAAITKDYSLNESNPYAEARFMGVDPAFGSSQFGVCIIELYDSKINVLYCDSWEHIQFTVAIQRVLDLMRKYRVAKVLVDAANPSVIKELKNRIGGDTEYLNYEV